MRRQARASLFLLLIATLVASASCSFAPSRAPWPYGPTGTPASAVPTATMPPTADDGPFHLELVLSRLQWITSETIAGSGSLSFRDSGEVTISGSGSGLIAFAYDEVNGNRHVG